MLMTIPENDVIVISSEREKNYQHFKILKSKYAVSGTAYYVSALNPLYPILQKLEHDVRLTSDELEWLLDRNILSKEILAAYHNIEAEFYNRTYKMTRKASDLAQAQQHSQNAQNPHNALLQIQRTQKERREKQEAERQRRLRQKAEEREAERQRQLRQEQKQREQQEKERAQERERRRTQNLLRLQPEEPQRIENAKIRKAQTQFQSEEKTDPLRLKYRISTQTFHQTDDTHLSAILQKLETRQRLTSEEFMWLHDHDVLTLEVRKAYHIGEAKYCESQYHQTRDLWNLANASSHWRKANQPKKAIALTDDIRVIDIDDQKLKSALLSTRGGALRDIEMFDAAEICALKAIWFQSESYRPYNLVGALSYDRGNYGEGDMWFTEAIKRGATPNDVDAEIKRIVTRTKGEERQQLVQHLLQKDPIRYAWAKDYLPPKPKIKKSAHDPKQPSMPQDTKQKQQFPPLFLQLCDVMKDLQHGQHDWIPFTQINQALRRQGIQIEAHQYPKFKAFMSDANKYHVVNIRQQGTQWEAQLTLQ